MAARVARFDDFVRERRGWFLLAIFAAALFIRLAYNFWYLDTDYRVGTLWLRSADSYSYYTLAHHILHLQPYTAFERAPFFPAVIALLQALLGRDPLHLRIVLSILGSFTCVLVFLLGEEAFSTRTAALASIASVFYLPLLIMNSMILSETLFVLLAMLAMLFVFRLERRRKTSQAVLAGLCMGLAALTRAEFLIVAVLVVLILWLVKRREHFGRFVLVILVIMAVLVVPWSAYASARNRTLVVISTSSGYTLLGSNNPKILKTEFRNRGQWIHPKDTWILSDADKESLKEMTQGQQSNFYMRKALRWLKGHPGEIPELLAWKLFAFWLSPIQFTSSFMHSSRPAGMMISYCIQYFTVLIMFVLGLVCALSPRRHWLFLVFLVGELAIAMVGYGNWRITVFLQPIYLLFAAAPLGGPRLRFLPGSRPLPAQA